MPAPSPRLEQCATCHWWVKLNAQRGECHGDCPRPVVGSAINADQLPLVLPQTPFDGFCRQWKKATAP